MEKEYLIDYNQVKTNKSAEKKGHCTQKTQDIDDIRKSHKRCGEVYMNGTEDFKFVCLLCEKMFYTNVEEFINHVVHCQLKVEMCSLEFDPLDPQGNYDYSPIEQTNLEVTPKEEVEASFDSNAETAETLNPIEMLSLSCDSDVENFNSKKIYKVDKTEKLNVKPDQSKKLCSSSFQIFSCNQCDKEYLWKRSLERHMKLNHQHEIETYTMYVYCDIPDCNKKFKKKESLDVHKRFEHKENSEEPMVEENDCSKDETNKDNSEETRKEFDRYTCKYCGQRFTAPYKRIQHERIHTGEKPFKCSICGKDFRIARSRNTHELIHQGIKPYKCDICDAAFLERSNLTQHIQRHIGEKKIQCGFCEKTFYSNTEKNLHERTHTGEKSYLCFECGKCFSSTSKLNTHIKRHSGIKPHKCDQCDKTFFSKQLLKDHYVVHTGEKPFTCHVCDSKFPRRKSLKSHLKIHSDIAQYTCNICGKSFKQGPGLYSHMKSHGKVLAKP